MRAPASPDTRLRVQSRPSILTPSSHRPRVSGTTATGVAGLRTFWDRTSWTEEDPIRRVARAASLPAGLLVIIVGAVTGNLLAIGSGISLIRLVAMAAPRKP